MSRDTWAAKAEHKKHQLSCTTALAFDDGSSSRRGRSDREPLNGLSNALGQRGSKCAMEVADDSRGSFAAITSVWPTILAECGSRRGRWFA
jgi:hypothetical protein